MRADPHSCIGFWLGGDTEKVSPKEARAMIRSIPRTMSGKQHFKLEGLVIAIVTPFQPYNLRVDEDSFIKYLQACPQPTLHIMAMPSQFNHCILLFHFQ